VVAVGPALSVRLVGYQAIFDRFVASLTASHATRDELRTYCVTRRAIDAGELARLSLPEIDRYRRLRDRLTTPAFAGLYERWIAGGDAVLHAYAQPAAGGPTPREGRLLIEALPFDYSQFGSLPGVA